MVDRAGAMSQDERSTIWNSRSPIATCSRYQLYDTLPSSRNPGTSIAYFKTHTIKVAHIATATARAIGLRGSKAAVHSTPAATIAARPRDDNNPRCHRPTHMPIRQYVR